MKEHLRRVAWKSCSIKASEWVGNIIHLAIKAVLVHKEVCKLFIVSSCLMSDHMYSKQSWIWECRSTVLLFCNNTYHVGLCNCSSCFNYPYRHEWEWYTMWRHGSIHHRTLLYSRVHAPPHLQVRETFSTIQNRLWAIIKSKNVLCIEGEKPFWFVRD